MKAWGRLVYANVLNPTTGLYVTNRIKWSGIPGSIEPFTVANPQTTPFIGADGFHTNGYLDLPASGGDIVGLTQFGTAVVVFQQRKMTILYGSPTVDGAGSLDANTSYDASLYLGCELVANTPRGLFFYDYVKGLMVWTGSGAPTKVSGDGQRLFLINNPPSCMGFVDDHVVLTGFSGGGGGLAFHTTMGSWSEFTSADFAYVNSLQPGRGSIAQGLYELVVGLDTATRKLVDFGVCFAEFNNGGADHAGTAVDFDIASSSIGDGESFLRPERAYITYMMNDGGTPDPALTLSIYTGMNVGQSAAANTASQVFGPVAGTTFVTRVMEMNLSAAPSLSYQVRLTGVPTYCAVNQIVITGSVEGMGAWP